MIHQNLIKVIKRAEREQAARGNVESKSRELSASENSRNLSATVMNWINESRQKRLAQYQTIEQWRG